MSGGVDSSVAAALLKKQGYEVIGIFMKLWADKVANTDLVKENICCSVEAATAARAVAHKLEIPFYVVNLEKEFKKAVVDYYVKEYEEGRTPNPCVICNRDIKGEVLMRKALEMEADFLATGHYARIREVKSQYSKAKLTEYKLLTAVDENKDQTYFLWTLTQKHLAKLLFPVGEYTKPDVRKMAAKMHLPTAERKESQGICFIPDRDVCAFLHRYAKKLTKPGPIMDKTGKRLGIHSGLINYTIGQRERLNIGGPRAYYVLKLNKRNNSLIVGNDGDLYKTKLIAESLNWITPKNKDQFKISKIGGRIRYGHTVAECKLDCSHRNRVKVTFDVPQRAITPGQSIVFYLPRPVSRITEGAKSRGDGKEVLGGGIIN